MDTVEIYHVLDNAFGVEPGTIDPCTPLAEVPDWDSLMLVGLLACVDEDCGVTLQPEAVTACQTVQDVHDLVARQLRSRQAA